MGIAAAVGSRALLLLHRAMTHEHVVAGIAAALAAGALTADAVAVEARKAAQAGSAGDMITGPDAPPAALPVTSLTQRRLAALPPDTRPLPSVAAYDQLLRRTPPAPSPSQGVSP